MKNRTFYLLIFFVFLVYFSIIIQENIDDNNDIRSSDNSDKRDKNNKNIKKADSWTLSPIVIDDNGGGDYNWSEAADQDWCSGSGTWGDPYVIQNITIDASSSGSCIEIRDSTAVFIIRNSTFIDAGGIDCAGIKLSNAANGLLINNTLISNRQGIGLYSSLNITIKENEIYNNDYSGIYLTLSNNNTIQENNLYQNDDGITFWHDCYNNSILYNKITNNADYGIYIYSRCENNTISNNLISGNDDGIYVYYYSSSYEISFNNISDNDYYGIYLDYHCDLYNISRNEINDNGYGILLEGGCQNNIISENNINDNDFYGIYLRTSVNHYCDFNSVIKNNLSNNLEEGIMIRQGRSNNLSENRLTGCGVVLIGSTEYKASNNIDISNLVNEKPLYFYTHEVWLNMDNFTNAGQLILINCSYSIISFMSISDASTGISLHDCDHNRIIGMTIENNSLSGIYLYYCDNTTVTDNNLNNNGIDIEVVSCTNSKIFMNLCDGIYSSVIIDNNGGGHITWAEATEYSWCSGSGTAGDPYIIENITIDAGGSGCCIEIKDSRVYFTIQNCTFRNAGNSGLELDNTTRGTIIDNDCLDNGWNGITLSYSNNNTISGNTAGNNQAGIYLTYSNNNTISENILNKNRYFGLRLYRECDNNKIWGNTINENERNGIHIERLCSYNTIWNNTVKENDLRGVYLYFQCVYNNITQNIIKENSYSGILLHNQCNYNNITQNIIKENSIHGIYFMDNCDNQIIKNNIIKNDITNAQNTGIYIWDYCDNNTILGNNIINHSQHGIHFDSRCNDNHIINNSVNDNNGYGIYLDDECEYNNITGNFINNTFSNNQDVGIFLQDESHYNIITENIISNNSQDGIRLWGSSYYLIFYNNITNHSNYNIYLSSDSIVGNIFNNSCDGVSDFISITIDETGNAGLTWKEAENFGISSGSGTLSAPYLINDLTIKNLGGTGGIKIFNTQSYFIIQNCKIHNSMGYAIYLSHANNGTIINNNCSDNSGHGISLYWSDNNTLSGNNLCNNNDFGIRVYYSESNIISNNNISYNGGGIRLAHSDHNSILKNKVNGNYNGIYLVDSKYINITENNCDNNNGVGIYLYEYCDYNNIINNSVCNNSKSGFNMYRYSDFNNITFNKFNNNSEYGIYINPLCSNNNIYENLINNNSLDGVYLYEECSLNNIINNTVNDNGNNGIYLRDQCNNNYIIGNNITNNQNIGIRLDDNCNQNNIIKNNLDNNTLGISLITECDYNLIRFNNITGDPNNNYILQDSCSDNQIYNRYNGDYIYTSIMIDNDGSNGITWLEASNLGLFTGLGTKDEPYRIENITINAGKGTSGLIIRDSQNVYVIIKNCTVYNVGSVGFYGVCIGLSNIHNSMILENNCSNNEYGYGITLGGTSENNTLAFNIVNNNYLGLAIGGSHNIISNNTANDNTYGLSIGGTQNTFLNNTISRNSYGIWARLSSCFNNSILLNKISYNNIGIDIRLSYNNTYINNTLNGNVIGVSIDDSEDNKFIGNLINGSSSIGIEIDQDSEGNIAFNNNFSNNALHVYDLGTNNCWNSSVIGNYWDNYTGYDGNNDGIGETPYIQGNLVDYLPICFKKDMIAPNITIISPIPFKTLSNNAPSFNIVIDDYDIDSSWYCLINASNSLDFTQNTTFIYLVDTKLLQSIWDQMDTGFIILRFFANDSSGNEAYENVTIYKDGTPPDITIDYPFSNELFGNTTISFSLTILDPNLNFTWYSLNGGQNYTFSGTSGTINQAAWNKCGNGTVTIKFYANDTLGNLGFKEVNVRKETSSPNITINLPYANDLLGAGAPKYNVTIDDNKLNTTWYSLNGGLNYTFTSSTGLFNQTAWDACGNGTVIITFYANNSAGNLNSEQLIVRKDIIAPIITINSPFPNELFGFSTCSFDISITEANLNLTWYTLNGGLKYNFTGTTGIINQTAWNAFGNETITIRFYANDTLGNESYDEVSVRKYTHVPDITIVSPTDLQTLTTYIINFNLNIDEKYIFESKYSLNGGSNYTFAGSSGTINENAWITCDNGNVNITFYVENDVGTIGSEKVTVIKNTPLLEKDAYAIIIGIENYPGTLDDLYYCRDDALSINSMLINRYHFKSANIILLLDSAATKSAITNAFSQVSSNIDSEDIFFFYYSGHGGYQTVFRQYICPYDSIPDTPSNRYYDYELNSRLSSFSAAEKYVVIDACYSGGMISESQSSRRFIMTACDDDELSYETGALGHGIFTYYFLRSPTYASDSNGDGVKSMEECFSYADARTVIYTSGIQDPQRYDAISGQAVFTPSICSLTLSISGNQLDYSFYIYGTRLIETLRLSVCGISPIQDSEIINLKDKATTKSGFGYYSGSIILEGCTNITGYEFSAEISYNLLSFNQKYGDTDIDDLYDIDEILKYGTDPNNWDTDGDSYSDGWEVANGYDPLDPDDPPEPDEDDDDDDDDGTDADGGFLIIILILVGIGVIGFVATIVIVKRKSTSTYKPSIKEKKLPESGWYKKPHEKPPIESYRKEESLKPEEMKYVRICKMCGNLVSLKLKFCIRCGAKLEEKPSPLSDDDIKLRIKDYIFNNLPPPKSPYSPEGRNELLKIIMIKNLLLDGNFSQAMNLMINCLKNGVPEPNNSQMKAYILQLLDKNNSEINSALAIRFLEQRICKSCGQLNKLTTKTCSNCGRFLL